MNQKHFEWKEEYSVNVKVLDEQHKQLFKSIDVLYQDIIAGKEKEALAVIFKELNQYSQYHFATEEKYFKEFNYAEADMHIALHEKFKKDLAEMEARVNNENFNAFELLDFLENWWINHILVVDKKYTKTFNEHGLY